MMDIFISFFKGRISIVVITFMKSLVDPKSEIYYYVFVCKMSLILPQGMKLIQGWNPNLNLVFKNNCAKMWIWWNIGLLSTTYKD